MEAKKSILKTVFAIAIIFIVVYLLSTLHVVHPLKLGESGRTGKSRWSVYIPGVTYLDRVLKSENKAEVEYYVTVPICPARVISPILNQYDEKILGKIYFNPMAWRDEKSGEIWVRSDDGFSSTHSGLQVDPSNGEYVAKIIETLKEIRAKIESGCRK